jgi:hypothetical protein
VLCSGQNRPDRCVIWSEQEQSETGFAVKTSVVGRPLPSWQPAAQGPPYLPRCTGFVLSNAAPLNHDPLTVDHEMWVSLICLFVFCALLADALKNQAKPVAAA